MVTIIAAGSLLPLDVTLWNYVIQIVASSHITSENFFIVTFYYL
jgi:hypothetical protein